MLWDGLSGVGVRGSFYRREAALDAKRVPTIVQAARRELAAKGRALAV